jgi:hypothetical protein
MARDVVIKITAEDSFSSVFQKFNTALGETQNTVTQTGTAVSGQKSAFDQLTGSVTGFIVAYAGIKGIQAVGEMLQLGDAVNKTQAVFSQLTAGIGGYASNMAALRMATGGVVDDMTLQQGAVKLLQMGIASNTDEMSRMAEMATKLGSAVGMDATKAMGDFSQMMANNSIMRLDNFGISSAKVRDEIKRLQDQFEGIDKSEAFKMAVLKVGAESLERLGDAADAGITPVKQLETAWTNYWNDFDSRVAQGVEGILGIIDVTGQWLAMPLAQKGVTTSQVSSIDYATMQAQASGDLQRLNEQNLAAQKLSSKTYAQEAADAYWNAYTDYWTARPDMTNVGAIYAKLGITKEQADAAGREWANQVRSSIEEQAIAKSAAQASLGAIMMGGTSFVSGGVPQYLESAQKYHDELTAIDSQMENLKSLAAAGFITDEQVNSAQAMRDEVAGMADQADRAAAAFQNMQLSDVFGQKGGGLAGQVSDAVIAQMRSSGKSDAEIAAAQRAMGLASGRETTASLTFQEKIVPLLANMNPEQMAAAMTNLQTFMQQGELAGLTPDQIAKGLPAATGFAQTGGGKQFTVQAGQSAGDIMAQTGMSLDQVLSATGATSARGIRTGTYGMGGFQQTAGFDPMALIQSLLTGGLGGGYGGARVAGGGPASGYTGIGSGALGADISGAGLGGKGLEKLRDVDETFSHIETSVTNVTGGASAMYEEFGKTTGELDRIKQNIMNIPVTHTIVFNLGLNDPNGVLPVIEALTGVTPGGLGTLIANNGGSVPGAPATTGSSGGGKGRR